MALPRRIGELDGIRAIAILAVLVGHFYSNERTAAAAAMLTGPAKVLAAIAGHGFLGVELFFVLSGFLITGILLDTRERPTYFRDFWIRRALRIAPLVVVVVALIAVIFRPAPLNTLLALAFATDLSSLFHTGTRELGPFWSLAVEEQFYLVWPLLVFALRPRTLVAAIGAILLIGPVLRGFSTGTLDLPWYHLDGLAIGALIAIFARSRFFTRERSVAACAGALALAATLAIVQAVAHIPADALRISEAVLAFGAAILGAVAFAGHARLAFLRSPSARFVADTSFCVYLIHVPLLSLVREREPLLTNPFAAASLEAALAVPAAFLIAALSRTYLELPFLRLKDGFSGPATAVAPIKAAHLS